MNIVVDQNIGFLKGGSLMSVNALGFENGKEIFSHSVVIRFPLLDIDGVMWYDFVRLGGCFFQLSVFNGLVHLKHTAFLYNSFRSYFRKGVKRIDIQTPWQCAMINFLSYFEKQL